MCVLPRIRSTRIATLDLSAVPFQTAADVSVNDHLEYMAVSSQNFPVPADGTLVLSTDVKVSTPGTVPELIQHGVYAPSGSWLDPAGPPTPRAYRAPGCRKHNRPPS
jgi:hypothetical protein